MDFSSIPRSVLWVIGIVMLTFIAVVSGMEPFVVTVGLALGAVSLIVERYARPSYWKVRAVRAGLRAGRDAWLRGDIAATERHYLKAIADAEQSGPKHDLNTGFVLAQLGAFYHEVGCYADAEPVFQRALRHLDEVMLAHDTQRVSVLNDLAVLYIQRGRFAEAEPLCRELLVIYETQNGPRDNSVAMMLHNLALIRKGQGEYDAAEKFLNESQAVMGDRMDSHVFAGWLLENLADLRRRQERIAEAEPIARRALAVHESCVGPEHFSLARCLVTLAEIDRLQGNMAEAEALCRRCLASLERALGPDHPGMAGALLVLARLAAGQAKTEEAEALYRRCLELRAKTLVPDHRDLVETMEEYAGLLRKMNREAEAEHWASRAKATPVWAVRTPAPQV